MFNQSNQQQFTQLMNQQAALQQEPNYSQPINPPSTVQVNDPTLFTGLYWMGRWVLQNVVIDEPYFIPTWNTLSANNFENQDYARCVARMCDAVRQRGVNPNAYQNEVVLPIFEMDAAVRWCSNVQLAEQILPPEYQQRAMEWKGQAEQLVASSQPTNTFAQASGNFGNQRPAFGQPAQTNAWQQQRGGFQQPAQSGWGSQNRQVSGTNRSGFFSDSQPQVSSRNAAGIRTTTTAFEQHSSPKPKQESTTDWKARGAVDKKPMNADKVWGARSSQSQTDEVTTEIESDLDALLPQHEFKSTGKDVNFDTPIKGPQTTGTTDMSHEVNVTSAIAQDDARTSTDAIKCPVLNSVVRAIYGQYLPKAAVVTGKDNQCNVLVLPHGQTDIPVVKLENTDKAKMGYDDGTILVDYIWADYSDESIVSKTVPVKQGEANMDYLKHTLNGPVAPVHPKHVVQCASLTAPASKVADEGMVTKHTGKTIDESRATYSTADTKEFAVASIRAQTQGSVDKSIETYDKLVTPFVVAEDFDRQVFADMESLDSDGFDEYVEKLGSLPRAMQLYVSAQLLSDVRYALDAQLDAELDISEFDDIGDVTDYLAENRSAKLAALWKDILTRIMHNNIRLVSDEMRNEAIAALGDSAPKTTDNLVLLERERYILALPYTLAELNITATSDEMFYIQDTSHAQLHESVQAIFSRLVKTGVSDFSLRLADGVVYRICKLEQVAKTYTFTKVK